MKPRVLQLIGSFHQGGSERQAVQLTRLLHQSGRVEVLAACLDANGMLRGEIEALGLGDIPEFALTSFYDRNFIRQVARFARHLKAQRIDVVHTHDFYTNIFGMTGAALAGVPVRIASRRESAKRPALHRRVERGAYRLAQTVLANCEEVRRQLIAEGVRAEQIVTVYNGLEIKRVQTSGGWQRADSRALFGLPAEENRQYVTLMANMRHPVKDHPLLLWAARRILDVFPDAAFLLAGEGELTASLRALASQLGLENDVFFLGRCEKVAELLAITDIGILCSRSEGFSNAILEYMAAGCPVVATDVGGAREAIRNGETGWLVPAGDEAALAERTLDLLRDPERARIMGQRGQAVVAQRFSSSAQLEQVENLYERLLGTRTRANRPLTTPGKESPTR